MTWLQRLLSADGYHGPDRRSQPERRRAGRWRSRAVLAAFVALALTNALAIGLVQHSSKRADRVILENRTAAVLDACQERNELRRVLREIVLLSAQRPGRDRNSPFVRQALAALADVDCAAKTRRLAP